MTFLLNPSTNEVMYQPQLWQISVNRYHEMIQAGLLTENDRLELLEGFLVEKLTVNPPHSFTTDQIRDLLMGIVDHHYFVKSQQPITLGESEPEPDVFVVAGEKRHFVQRHPDLTTYGEADDLPVILDGTQIGALSVRDLLP